MTVLIKVNIGTSKLTNVQKNVGIDKLDDLDRMASFFVEGYQYTQAYKSGYYDSKTKQFKHWDGKRHLLNNKLEFPTGLLSMVTDFFKDKNIPFQIDDIRPKLKFGEELPLHGFTPRPHQIGALNAVLKHKSGIIKVATGGGKTKIAAMIVAKYNIPSMIYVIGKDLLYQIHNELKQSLQTDIGIIGDGHVDVKKINVCSVWTAINSFGLKQKISLDDEDWTPDIFEINNDQKKQIKYAIENSNLVIYDEAHYLATDTIQTIFKASKKCHFSIGLTASPWRDDGADLLIESVCGSVIFDMPASKLIDNGFLVPPNITILNVPPVNTPSKANYHSIYSNYIINNEVRNKMIVDSVKILLERERKILILVKNISHGKNLIEMLEKLDNVPLYFVNGKVSGEEREKIKEDFKNGVYKCLIASSVFDIGVDLPFLDALILGGSGKSTVRTLQRIGRVIRTYPNKKDAIVVDFFDNAKHLDKHSATRISVYNTEDKFNVKLPKDFDCTILKKHQKAVLDKIKP